MDDKNSSMFTPEYMKDIKPLIIEITAAQKASETGKIILNDAELKDRLKEAFGFLTMWYEWRMKPVRRWWG
jgi:hypothetical protein